MVVCVRQSDGSSRHNLLEGLYTVVQVKGRIGVRINA